VLLILSLLQFTSIVQIVPKGTFLPYWFCFTLGAMTYWVLARWVPVTYLAVLASLVLVAGVVFGNPWCMTAVLTATLLYTAGRAGTMATWLSGRGIQFLGRISYSLYLFHAIVGWSAMSVALRYLPQQMNAWQSAGAGVVGIVFSIMSASVVYLLVERFSVRLSHKISLEPAPMAMAQAATETI